MPLKIMSIDNEPMSLKLMRSLAVPLGHMVLTVEGGLDAIGQAEKRRFDVIFVGLAQTEALDFTRRIRASQLNSETNVVFLSATNDIEMLRAAYGAGVTFVMRKPVTAAHIAPMLRAMDSPTWKTRMHAARMPLFTEVHCRLGDRSFSMRSMNISEGGMLLQTSEDVEVGQEVSLEFKIAEFSASLNVRARVVRKEGSERAGVGFISLTREDQNVIQLYVIGRLEKHGERFAGHYCVGMMFCVKPMVLMVRSCGVLGGSHCGPREKLASNL